MNKTYRWFDKIQVMGEELFAQMMERFEEGMMSDRQQIIQMPEDMQAEAEDGSYTPENPEEVIDPTGGQLVQPGAEVWGQPNPTGAG